MHDTVSAPIELSRLIGSPYIAALESLKATGVKILTVRVFYSVVLVRSPRFPGQQIRMTVKMNDDKALVVTDCQLIERAQTRR
jgi:hypothetical protein